MQITPELIRSLNYIQKFADNYLFVYDKRGVILCIPHTIYDYNCHGEGRGQDVQVNSKEGLITLHFVHTVAETIFTGMWQTNNCNLFGRDRCPEDYIPFQLVNSVEI